MKASLLGAALIALVLAGVAREAIVAPPPVPAWVAPAPLGADEIANIYVAMLARMTHADGFYSSQRTTPFVITRTIFQTCLYPKLLEPGAPRPPPRDCASKDGVGPLPAAIEASLRAELARAGVDLVFVDDNGVRNCSQQGVNSLHEIILLSADVAVADEESECESGMQYQFTRIDGRWRVTNEWLTWIT